MAEGGGTDEAAGGPLDAARSESGELTLRSGRLEFKGSALRARLGQPVADRAIDLQDVKDVSFQAPSFFRMGRIQVTMASGSRLGFSFQKWERQDHERLFAALRRQLALVRSDGRREPGPPSEALGTAASSETATAPADIVDRIRDLGRLRDEGLLTDVEFETKKRELLERL